MEHKLSDVEVAQGACGLKDWYNCAIYIEHIDEFSAHYRSDEYVYIAHDKFFAHDEDDAIKQCKLKYHALILQNTSNYSVCYISVHDKNNIFLKRA